LLHRAFLAQRPQFCESRAALPRRSSAPPCRHSGSHGAAPEIRGGNPLTCSQIAPCHKGINFLYSHTNRAQQRTQEAFCFTPAQVWRSLRQFCRLVSVVLSNLSFSTFSGRSAAQRPKVPNETLCAALVHMYPPPGPFRGPLRV
jgi:hypothetical protein